MALATTLATSGRRDGEILLVTWAPPRASASTSLYEQGREDQVSINDLLVQVGGEVWGGHRVARAACWLTRSVRAPVGSGMLRSCVRFLSRRLDVTTQQRALRKRAADLCRAEPATYATVVRYADHLRAAGVAHDDALEQALRRWGR